VKKESSAGLRSKIDRLDREIIKLANERAALTVKAIQASGEGANELPHGDPRLAQLLQANKGPLATRCLHAILRELECGSRAIVKPTRVAYLGPPYSYSHLAAMHRFGQTAELVPVGGIGAVFEEVYRGQVHFGLVPLENSTDGRVADTLDMFTRVPARICGEVQLSIHHCLLAKCPRAELKEVYSRPQALSQCRNWLAKHLPTVRVVEVTSTSTAAQLAQDKPGAGAIASIQAAVHYGLDVLAENIEDNPGNVTRFAVIGDRPAPRTGHDKVALMFEVDHRIGALCDATAVFKRNRLNMTWIESFPVPERQGSYLFFVELEGHETDAKVKRAVAALQRKTLRLEILGSYERATPAG
jgi:chorismate mutase/prephenate dehydratase